MNGCGQCGKERRLCIQCHNCTEHCHCGLLSTFDADELGLDPETDNTPEDESRHA
jgi:hypothetical protein